MPSERTMANGDERVLVGTVGEGLYVSDDGGATFKRPSNNGLYIEGEVRALAAHPGNPSRIYAGTHAGVYRSDGPRRQLAASRQRHGRHGGVGADGAAR